MDSRRFFDVLLHLNSQTFRHQTYERYQDVFPYRRIRFALFQVRSAKSQSIPSAPRANHLRCPV